MIQGVSFIGKWYKKRTVEEILENLAAYPDKV